MKRVLPIFLTFVLVLSLAIPAFAYDTTDLPYSSVAGKPYVLVVHLTMDSYEWTRVAYCEQQVYIGTDGTDFALMGADIYEKSSSGWDLKLTDASTSWAHLNPEVLYTSHDILYPDGTLYMKGALVFECDGSSCPAHDANFDNICDDCGLVLTMSLRSTLLDFAKAQAQSWIGTWPYHAVVKETDEYYNVYMSTSPMVVEDGWATGTSMIVFSVSVNPDGSHSATGNYSAEPWQGEILYANHEVNFPLPPLAVTIQGVTEGEILEVMVPDLTKTMKILALCGVGLMALLVLLVLLRKKSPTFLP